MNHCNILSNNFVFFTLLYCYFAYCRAAHAYRNHYTWRFYRTTPNLDSFFSLSLSLRFFFVNSFTKLYQNCGNMCLYVRSCAGKLVPTVQLIHSLKRACVRTWMPQLDGISRNDTIMRCENSCSHAQLLNESLIKYRYENHFHSHQFSTMSRFLFMIEIVMKKIRERKKVRCFF